jgi:hypothetical protein
VAQNYDEGQLLSDYVWNHCYAEMTESDRSAVRAIQLLQKANIVGNASVKNQILRLMERESILDFAKSSENDIEGLKSVIRNRVLEANPHLINRCPKCFKVTRTPRAKQCRWCYHDWH